MDVHAIRKYCTIGGLIGRDKSQVNNYSHSEMIAVVACQSHKLEVVGSSPTLASNNINIIFWIIQKNYVILLFNFALEALK